jgi:hypothetical protein
VFCQHIFSDVISLAECPTKYVHWCQLCGEIRVHVMEDGMIQNVISGTPAAAIGGKAPDVQVHPGNQPITRIPLPGCLGQATVLPREPGDMPEVGQG